MIDIRHAERLSAANFTFRRLFFKKCAERWRLRRTLTSRHCLVYFKSGTMEVSVDGRRLLVKPGRVLLLVPGSIVEAQAVPGEPPAFYLLEFDCSWPAGSSGGDAESEPRSGPFRDGVDWPVQSPARIEQMLERLRGIGRSGHALWRWERQIEFQRLLYAAATETAAPAKPEEGGMSAAVAAVLRYMNEHYRENLQFRSLSAMYGISPTNFAAVFRKQVGVTPREYVTGLRMEEAKKRLAANERMEEVARLTGYKDTLYFSRLFKKAVGLSPTFYVKKYRRERIMTLFHHMNDYLLALGLSPHFTLSYEGNDQVNGLLPYIADSLRETRIVGGWERPDVRAVFQAGPHLILGTDRNRPLLEKVSAIAPTVAVPLGDDWKSVLSELSALFDRKEQMRSWLDHFERKVKLARERLAGAGMREQSVMVLIAADDELRVYGGRRQFGEILYKELQLTPPPGFALQDHYRTVSHAELAALDPDHIFLSTCNSNHRGEQVRLLKESACWPGLKAVRHRRVYEVQSWLNGHAPSSTACPLTQPCLACCRRRANAFLNGRPGHADNTPSIIKQDFIHCMRRSVVLQSMSDNENYYH